MRKLLPFLCLFLPYFMWGQLSFQDNASSKGVGVSYGKSGFGGGGVSFCDFDGDGWDDITYSTKEGEEVLFFKNTNGTFAQVDLGINDTYQSKQVIWVDHDNDGDKDFFVTNIVGINKFYENNGDMTFTDITESCGLFTEDLFTTGASFGDIDNDGDLDVFICNRDNVGLDQFNYLYRNDNGVFTDITASSGIGQTVHTPFCSSFFDYDNDGDQDIYVISDRVQYINRLYRNNGDNTFTDVSVSSGAGLGTHAMSATIGDYNYDGWFDIYVTNTEEGNHLLKNNQDGTFTDISDDVGTGFYSIAWGANFLDADNDSDLDLYVSGMLDGSTTLPSAFYENKGDNTFQIPENIGFENDTRTSYANAVGDFNNDGLPDIIVMNDTEDNFLWENTTKNAYNWLKVKLKGTTSNRDGIGSTIEISANGKKQFRYTLCGEAYLAQNSNAEFFGLKDATNIDYVKVTWLSGMVSTFNNVDVNKTITIVEGQSTLSSGSINKTNFSIYPNPSNGDYTIQLKTLNTDEELTVYDVSGRKIKTKKLVDLNTAINLHDFSEGIYFFKIQSNRGSATRKVVYSK